MEAHGGSAEVESEQAAEAFPAGLSGGDMMGAQRILIIEDEPDLFRGLEMNLTAEGFEVLTASRGDTGVEQALRERPSLVLLDIMLPGMNGLDVCASCGGKASKRLSLC